MKKNLPAIRGANKPEAAICNDLLDGPVDHAVSFRV